VLALADKINGVSQLSGVELFERLSDEEKAHYISTNREMVGYALDHAVPLIIALLVSAGGEIKGATGSILRTPSGAYLLTASHVLGGYERRTREGERLNWQFGKLPPFDPLARIAWRDERRDVVLLRLTENDVQGCRIAVPPPWPPPIPAEGEFVAAGRMFRLSAPKVTVEVGGRACRRDRRYALHRSLPVVQPSRSG
jgi:hypothetical protein